MRWWRWGDLYATYLIHCDRRDHLAKEYTNRSSWNESTNETVLLANDLFFTKTWRSEGIKKRPSTRPQIANFPIFSVLLNTFIQFNLLSDSSRSTRTLGSWLLRYDRFAYILISCERSRVSPLHFSSPPDLFDSRPICLIRPSQVLPCEMGSPSKDHYLK